MKFGSGRMSKFWFCKHSSDVASSTSVPNVAYEAKDMGEREIRFLSSNK